MITDFRIELARLLSIVAGVMVAGFSLMAHVTLQALFFRVVIGASIFAVIGYLLGNIIEQQREIVRMEQEKERLKSKVKENIEQAVEKKEINGPEEFTPLDIQNLSKIIVDTMNE